MFEYKEIDPPKPLEKFVHCLWVFEQSGGNLTDKIVPDGRPELVVHIGEPYWEVSSGTQQPRVLFAGQLTKSLHIQARGSASILAVRFRPDGAHRFLRSSVASVTDKRLPMASIAPGSEETLLQTINAQADKLEQLSALGQFVAARIGPAEPDHMVRALVEAALVNAPIEYPSHVRPRQVQRRFKQATGVSLRTFRAIRRFRSVFDRMQAEEQESWVERALEAGYFDQPQMARDFQRFLGCSAREWVESAAGLGLALGTN
ncbi:MAG: helix-turn-helix domain-containing protein [Pseudomonadota bacterium]